MGTVDTGIMDTQTTDARTTGTLTMDTQRSPWTHKLTQQIHKVYSVALKVQ